MPMFRRIKYRFFRLLEELEGNNQQKNARSDREVDEYAEKTGEEAIEINDID